MRVIARELLGLNDTAMTMIAANCLDKSYELNFKILEKWRNVSRENNRSVSLRFVIYLPVSFHNVFFLHVITCCKEGLSLSLVLDCS